MKLIAAAAMALTMLMSGVQTLKAESSSKFTLTLPGDYRAVIASIEQTKDSGEFEKRFWQFVRYVLDEEKNPSLAAEMALEFIKRHHGSVGWVVGDLAGRSRTGIIDISDDPEAKALWSRLKAKVVGSESPDLILEALGLVSHKYQSKGPEFSLAMRNKMCGRLFDLSVSLEQPSINIEALKNETCRNGQHQKRMRCAIARADETTQGAFLKAEINYAVHHGTNTIYLKDFFAPGDPFEGCKKN